MSAKAIASASWRVRQRQERHRAVDPATAAARHHAYASGTIRIAGRTCCARRERPCGDPRPRDRDDLPGSDVVAQSGADHRRPDFRDVASAQGLDGAAARKRVVELLELVRIPDAARRADDYPHRLSGGMRQRVMIAMAIACKPRLLIADEPTTALDVTIQAQILELLRDLRKELSMSVMLISHDLGVIAEFAQRVIVMYAGRVVEDAPVSQLFRRPVHPYTMGLIAAVPKLDSDAPRLATIAGRIPSPQEVIPGCRFSPRCALVQDGCLHEQPSMQLVGDRQSARCPPRLLALGERHG